MKDTKQVPNKGSNAAANQAEQNNSAAKSLRPPSPIQLQPDDREEVETEEKKTSDSKKSNNTGIPDDLKTGVEELSGVDISDTKVQYNSPKPAQMKAHAFAQGKNIHVAPGQEKHLAHETWHLVQQKQGRVQPTTQMKQGLAINDDPGLEQEADVMGAKAMQKKEIKTAGELPKNQNISASGEGVVQGLFGSEKYRDQWQPGMAALGGAKESGELGWKGVKESGSLALSGADKSLSMAGSGMKASMNFAAAPASWAKKGMADPNSKLKKAGYALGGFFGSLATIPLGLVGAVASGGLGLAGAITSGGLGLAGAGISTGLGVTGAALGGGLGAVGMAGGGLYKGGKTIFQKGKKNLNRELLGEYKQLSTHEKYGDKGAMPIGPAAAGGEFNPDGTRTNYSEVNKKELGQYGLLGAAGASAVSSTVTDMASKGNVVGASIAQNNFQSPLAGAADAFGGLGAAGGILGTGAALMDTVNASGEAANTANSGQTRAMAGGQAVSSAADAVKSSATAAYNIASLIDAKGAAAAGAQVAAGGAAIAMGAIDMIRGGYGVYTAVQRQTFLESIEKNATTADVEKIAAEAIAKQKRAKWTGGGLLAKGALAVAGGVLLAAAISNPIGWMLLGAGAAIGIASAIKNWHSKKAQKKAVAERELGVTKEEKEAYKTQKEAIKEKTSYFTKERKDSLQALGKKPLEKKLQQYNFSSIGHFYSNYMNATANKIYTDGVVNGQEEYVSIINGIGLKIDKKGVDSSKWKPTPAQISKALSG